MFTAILDRFEDIELAGDPVWSTRMVIRASTDYSVRASPHVTALPPSPHSRPLYTVTGEGSAVIG